MIIRTSYPSDESSGTYVPTDYSSESKSKETDKKDTNSFYASPQLSPPPPRYTSIISSTEKSVIPDYASPLSHTSSSTYIQSEALKRSVDSEKATRNVDAVNYSISSIIKLERLIYAAFGVGLAAFGVGMANLGFLSLFINPAAFGLMILTNIAIVVKSVKQRKRMSVSTDMPLLTKKQPIFWATLNALAWTGALPALILMMSSVESSGWDIGTVPIVGYAEVALVAVQAGLLWALMGMSVKERKRILNLKEARHSGFTRFSS